MQIKTIQKTIAKKLTDWLDTIEDKTLSKKLKNNILVSGGSITSLLLNEPVNDYDVYIKDMDVLLELVNYYVKPFDDIEILDGRKPPYAVPESDAAHDVSVRNLKPNQIKLFFDDKNGGMRVNEDKKEEELNYTPIFFSPNETEDGE